MGTLAPWALTATSAPKMRHIAADTHPWEGTAAMPTIPYDALEDALEWVSSLPPFQHAAYISETTGQVFYDSAHGDAVDKLPDDYEDAGLYWTVPHKNELDLGSRLAHRFAEERAPQYQQDVVDIFGREGAYARFKALLERLGLLETWCEFEHEATQAALLAWAEEQGMSVEGRGAPGGA